VDHCPRYNDVQFLKHSPVYDNNNQIRPLLNPGVFFRASGVCRGELPGRGDFNSRALAFQAGLIQGAYPSVDTPFVNIFKNKNPTRDINQVMPFTAGIKTFSHKVADTRFFSVTSEEVFARYHLTTPELELLLTNITNASVGDQLCCAATGKVLKLDYDLDLPQRDFCHDIENPAWESA
jgi:hypothetical protein